MANLFTKFLANIFDFAVIFRLVQIENKTACALLYTMSIMHNQSAKLSNQADYWFCFIIARYRPPDVLLGSKDYTTSLDMW